jgi:hypothetical protein
VQAVRAPERQSAERQKQKAEKMSKYYGDLDALIAAVQA